MDQKVDYLFVDTDFLCHRALHALGPIKRGRRRVEIYIGVFREISALMQRYEPRSVVWCFDSRHSLRKKVYPKYKSNRVIDAETKGVLILQKNDLRKKYLRRIGFRNTWIESGYEADDLIATLASRIHFDSSAVIVSGDNDLLQCLSKNVRVYNPASKKEETLDSFKKKWGCHPMLWGTIKSIAGCSTDCIQGVQGVGEVTACKWVKGVLGSHTKKYKAIVNNSHIVEQNRELVVLPFKGLESRSYKIRKDHLTRGQWVNVLRDLGIDPLPYPGE